MTVLAIIAALVIGRLCGSIDAEMRADDANAEREMWNDARA